MLEPGLKARVYSAIIGQPCKGEPSCIQTHFGYHSRQQPMKNILSLFLLIVLTASKTSAAGEDAFYKLGPDSLVQEGVQQGKLLGPMHLPSQVFSNYTHTYW